VNYFWKTVWLLLAVTSCAKPKTVAEPAQPKPSKDEILENAIGEVFHQLTLEPAGIYENERLSNYVSSVGKRIARCAPKSRAWQFSIIDDANVAGHALPGAHIRLTRGLLAYLSSEAELAAVLAHEIAHVGHGHTMEHWNPQLPPLGSGERAQQAFERDRDEERQADALGTEYLACAGYAPIAMAHALAALERALPSQEAHDPSDPHPAHPTRMARLALQADGRSGDWNRERYLKRIDRIPFGERAGARLDQARYVSPGELSFALPTRYDVELKNSLLTTKKGEPSLVIMRLSGKFWRAAIENVLASETHTVQSIAGARALVGTMSGGENAANIALVDGSRHSFVIAVSGGTAESREVLDYVLESARPAQSSEPPVRRIAIRSASTNTSFSRFMKASCPSTSLELGRALNGLRPNQRVAAGTVLKCVDP